MRNLEILQICLAIEQLDLRYEASKELNVNAAVIIFMTSSSVVDFFNLCGSRPIARLNRGIVLDAASGWFCQHFAKPFGGSCPAQRVHLWLRYSLKSSSHYILVVVGVVGVSERSRLVLFGPCADGAGDEEGRWFKSRSRSGASL